MIHGTSLRGRQVDEEISSGGIQSLLTLWPATPPLHEGFHIWASFWNSTSNLQKLPSGFNLLSAVGMVDTHTLTPDCSLKQQQQWERHSLICTNMFFEYSSDVRSLLPQGGLSSQDSTAAVSKNKIYVTLFFKWASIVFCQLKPHYYMMW